MITLPTAKWIMILVLTTPCGGMTCSDGITVAQVPFETRELCLSAGNFAERKLGHGRTRATAICVEVALLKKRNE